MRSLWHLRALSAVRLAFASRPASAARLASVVCLVLLDLLERRVQLHLRYWSASLPLLSVDEVRLASAVRHAYAVQLASAVRFPAA